MCGELFAQAWEHWGLQLSRIQYYCHSTLLLLLLFFFIYDGLVLLDINTHPVEQAHIDIGDPDHGEATDQPAPPVVV